MEARQVRGSLGNPEIEHRCVSNRTEVRDRYLVNHFRIIAIYCLDLRLAAPIQVESHASRDTFALRRPVIFWKWASLVSVFPTPRRPPVTRRRRVAPGGPAERRAQQRGTAERSRHRRLVEVLVGAWNGDVTGVTYPVPDAGACPNAAGLIPDGMSPEDVALGCARAPPDPPPLYGRWPDRQRIVAKQARSSATNVSGCSNAAKWPPLSRTL